MKAFITGIGLVNTRGMGSGRESVSFGPSHGTLPSIERRQLFGRGFKHFGRLDAFSRVGLAGIAHALKDAGLADWQTIDRDGSSPSPALFSYTLPNSFLGEAAVYFGLTGPSYTLTDPSPANLFCVHTAMELMSDGQAQGMLSGQCDVTAPPELPLPTAVISGCTFFMMEKVTRPGTRAYGRLEKNADNRLLFNDRPVSSLTALLARCIETTGGSH